ncbi:site-specific integrase [Actinotalea sp. K2]|uniref:tyrosine-type recombinase/integrase n=1 Tax=Actinotalea sp. K2 TaxID=2939438 RepID=UPI002017FF3E|nr:site-specific integrase [Actinotalea sp. K2]MCL3860638.1 site-specific integrase [Actinotalea sp. K2]
MGGKRGFGAIRRLPSGAYQARYTGPDGLRHQAPWSFATKEHADVWLAGQRTDISRGVWTPPGVPGPDEVALTFGTYAEAWVAGRDLKPRTRAHYESILATRLVPAFGKRPLDAIRPSDVRLWHATTDATKPTIRAHSYALLRTIFATAVADDLVPTNPCRIVGAGTTRRAGKTRPASLAELEVLVAAMPERLRLMVLLGAWCALRFGELAELRRMDVDLKRGIVRVRRGVVRVSTEVIVGTPKSTAGVRDVAVPPHLMSAVRAHLNAHVGAETDALLFPASDGRNMSPNSLYWHYYPARVAAGRPDLRFHDLRHTGAVLAASTGATLAELMARLGHSTPAAAMKYQHAAADRDRVIADALSRLASAPPSG